MGFAILQLAKHARGPSPGLGAHGYFNPSGTEGSALLCLEGHMALLPWPPGWILVGIFFSQRFVELLLPEVGICLVCEVCVRMLMSVREGSSVAFLMVCTCGLRCLELINITIVKMKSSC